jgi:uncharacterized protein (TIGR02145 family)
MVLVKPIPDLTFSPAMQSVCYGQQAQVTLSTSLPGALCSWTATGSSPAVTGFSGGSGNAISQNLFTTGTTTQTVTYFMSSSLNGCTSPVSQASVLTYPVPDMTITPPVQSICSGQYTGISLASQLAGTTFLWSASGSPTVSGYSGSGGNSIVQLLNNSINTVGWVTYTVTPAVAGCTGPPSAVTVNVQPNPAVVFSLCTDTITTTAAKPFILNGGLPKGGQYSGPGVRTVSGKFDPSVSGTGLIPVTYTYTNAYGCPASLTGRIHVLAPPSFTCGSLLTDVRDNSHYGTFQLSNGKCWMTENLDYGVQVPGSTPQTDNCIPEKYLHPASFIPHPAFYQWDEVMRYDKTAGVQGLCPPGWHVPSSAEWDELVSLMNGPGQAAGPMKDQWLMNGFHSYQPGLFYLNGTWAYTTGLYAGSMYWTSSTPVAEQAVARGLNAFNPSVSLYNSSRANAFSVRCLKDY